MKNVRYSILGLPILLTIGMFFSPYLKIYNVDLSIINIIFSYHFNPLFILFIAPFILILFVEISCYFLKKNKVLPSISFIFSLTSTLLFIFSKQIFMSATMINNVTFSISSIVMFILGFAYCLYVASYLFDNNKLLVKDIVEIGIFVSFAIVLDIAVFKVKLTATGGSISFVMVPLFIICMRKGFIKGFISCGIVYGFINCLLDGYGLFTYPFDYLLGFGSLAILGLFRKYLFVEKPKFKNYLFLFIGVLLSLTGRLMASTLSGIIYYKLDFVGSLIYNITYLGPSGGICFAVLLILYRPILKASKPIICKYS